MGSPSELLTKLTAISGWEWRGVGKACWRRENAARSTLKSNRDLSARYSRNEGAGDGRLDQAAWSAPPRSICRETAGEATGPPPASRTPHAHDRVRYRRHAYTRQRRFGCFS